MHKQIIKNKIRQTRNTGPTKNPLAEIGKISCLLLHDIINPVNGLTLMVENMNQFNKIPITDRDKILQSITESSLAIRNFLKIAEDFIHKEDKKKIISINKIIQNILEIYKVKSIRNDIKIILISDTIKDLIISKPLSLYQILMNLISNSIDAHKETDSKINKQIVIKINESSEQKLLISIADNGCGIPPKNLNKIFEPKFSTKKDGFGYGLYGVKNLIKKEIKGEIKVRSVVKVGTEFIITIPSSIRILHSLK